MRKKRGWLLIALLAFLAAGVCVFFVWKREYDKEQTKAMYQQMRQEVKLPEELPGQTEVPETESEELVIPVDFEELQKMNPDIYAWITIPGTAVDYPVLQNEQDNARYLKRSATGEDSASGAIFSENSNATDFSDVHTVLYGHNMKDGTMFADLHKYEDKEFFEKHRVFAVYTPDAIRYYQVFAAYLYDDRNLLQSFDCSDPEVFEAYLRSIREQRNLYANLDEEVRVEAGDRILTLSTCHSMGDKYRYLVQAILIKEQKG